MSLKPTSLVTFIPYTWSNLIAFDLEGPKAIISHTPDYKHKNIYEVTFDEDLRVVEKEASKEEAERLRLEGITGGFTNDFEKLEKIMNRIKTKKGLVSPSFWLETDGIPSDLTFFGHNSGSDEFDIKYKSYNIKIKTARGSEKGILYEVFENSKNIFRYLDGSYELQTGDNSSQCWVVERQSSTYFVIYNDGDVFSVVVFAIQK